VDYAAFSACRHGQILLPRTYRSLLAHKLFYTFIELHFFAACDCKCAGRKNAIGEYCRKACLQMHSLLTRRKETPSIDMYLPENEGKIACAGREAFMIWLSYKLEIFAPSFSALLLVAAYRCGSGKANRFAKRVGKNVSSGDVAVIIHRKFEGI
jgi:hypothetical protein